MSRADALRMANTFATGTGTAFPMLGVTRAVFATQLRDRVASPMLIDQGSSSLCGLASFLYNLASKNPMAYANYAIELYAKGSAWIGKLKVAPGTDCKNAHPSGLSAVDWVTLAGLRDGSNALLDYQASSDQAAGITMPGALAGWFQRCGYYSGVVNDTNVILDKGLSCLLKGDGQRLAGGYACLFIGANILSGRPSGDLIPDHWVVLASDVRVDGKPAAPLLARGSAVDSDKTLLGKALSFQLFTWGGVRALPRMSVAKFLDYFYGYVGAK